LASCFFSSTGNQAYPTPTASPQGRGVYLFVEFSGKCPRLILYKEICMAYPTRQSGKGEGWFSLKAHAVFACSNKMRGF